MHSPLLNRFLAQLQQTAVDGPILDLACGSGRNGLYLHEHGCNVVFADRNTAVLADVAQSQQLPMAAETLWEVDFEARDSTALKGRNFAAIIVFRYLHRPLFASIRDAIQPGGLIVYETFTVDQPRYGRPTNPDFLLRKGELNTRFSDWDILYQFEGIKGEGDQRRAVAQLVARKPV